MKKFLVLYMAPVASVQEMMRNMTPQDQKRDMAEWNTWMSDNGQFFADRGTGVGKNTRVTKEGGEEISNEVLGYSIMQAQTKEELISVIRQGNHLAIPNAYTEVMECIEMPDVS